MSRFDSFDPARSQGAGPDRGDYRGEGIWAWCRHTHTARRLTPSPILRGRLDRAEAESDEGQRGLCRSFGLSDPDGRWQIFPEQQLFKVTLGDGRSWFARYGFLASWSPETHSWLWAWGAPKSWGLSPELLVPAIRMREAGAAQGWQPATEPALLVNRREGWRLSCLAAELAALPIVYRCRVNPENIHYYAIDHPVWVS